MNRLLVICGPTATGKTALALQLADHFNGEIISADSRQVYCGLDVGTGKDIPLGAKFRQSRLYWQNHPVKYYQIGAVRLWGYDLVDFWQPFSAAHFYDIGWRLIRDIQSRHRLPVIVGGTGHYLKTLLHPPASLGIKPNHHLRQQLSSLPLNVLQQRLQQTNPAKWSAMNQSDRANPRRLIRALEITQTTTGSIASVPVELHNVFQIGLDLPPALLKGRIAQRVAARISPVFTDELKQILEDKHFSSKLPSLSATGYAEGVAVLLGNADWPHAQAQWLLREIQYAKRQRTWFKTSPDIHWFRADDKHLYHKVVTSVNSWYAKPYGRPNHAS